MQLPVHWSKPPPLPRALSLRSIPARRTGIERGAGPPGAPCLPQGRRFGPMYRGPALYNGAQRRGPLRCASLCVAVLQMMGSVWQSPSGRRIEYVSLSTANAFHPPPAHRYDFYCKLKIYSIVVSYSACVHTAHSKSGHVYCKDKKRLTLGAGGAYRKSRLQCHACPYCKYHYTYIHTWRLCIRVWCCTEQFLNLNAIYPFAED